MAQKKKLGELLQEAGLIDAFKLGAALSHQRSWGGKLGAILVEMGFVEEKDVARTIASSLRLPFVDLFDPPIAPAVLKLIKPDFAKKHSLIPARKEGETVILAMVDPLNILVLDEVRFIIGLPVKPAFALEHDIRDAIRKYYDGEEIVRTSPKLPAFEPQESSGPMEIVRSGLRPEPHAAAPQAHRSAAADHELQQHVSSLKLNLESLITLLIEKGLIDRAELRRIIEQKDLGL